MAYINQRPLSQGEATFFPVTHDHFDGALPEAADTTETEWIIAHSESGNHHVLDRADADVVTIEKGAIGILRAIVTNPNGAVLRNKSASGHADLTIPAGLYEVRIQREVGLDDLIRRAAD